ncbi:MAG TPA: GIDE domain-containing protein, partial [Steroidobacteraceae bacterium]|nr:GIDE domain-containing protein [Steroidobacteraceae bacterium]
AALAAAAAYCFWYACKAWIKSRLVADTPTSRIRSAAQGYAALCGRALPADETAIKGPLTGRPCTWWRYEIEERRYTGRSRSWCTVGSDTSSVPFVLDDGTGRCLIDPRGAEVYPTAADRWYGPTPWPQGRIPDVEGILGWLVNHFVTDRYRYTEHRLESHEEVYSIGLFHSLGGVRVDDGEAAAGALLHDWKQDRAALLARFDTDHDGNISSEEWERAREAARREAERQRVAEERRPTVNVLADPMDGRAFLLAALAGEPLARRFHRKLLAGAGGFVAGAGALAWMLEHV